MSGAIQQDAQNTTSLTPLVPRHSIFATVVGPQIMFAPPGEGDGTSLNNLDDAQDAFLNAWKEGAPEEELPEDEEEDTEDTSLEDTDETETSEETPEDQESEEDDSESEDDEAENDDEEDEKDRKVLKDSDVVKIKVNGEELAVPVEKLKRLYGQEAALTQKSQEVAAKRKEVEDQGARYVQATDSLLMKARDRYQPYSQIDWLVAAKELSGEELTALRTEATKAYQDIQFLEQELDGVMQTVSQQRHTELVTQAKETLKELSDPVKGIKGFNQQLYTDMTAFAVSQGIPQDVVNNLVSAPILKLLHKAMLYDKGSKVLTKTTDKKPKKIVKGRVNSETSTKAFTPNKKSDAVKRLAKDSSTDAVADAFLSRWQD